MADKAFRAIVYHIMQNLDDDGAIALTNKALELLNNRSMSFLHTMHGVRMMLRDVYDELEQYDQAARVMEKLSSNNMKDTFKMEYPKYADSDIAYWKWLRILFENCKVLDQLGQILLGEFLYSKGRLGVASTSICRG